MFRRIRSSLLPFAAFRESSSAAGHRALICLTAVLLLAAGCQGGGGGGARSPGGSPDGSPVVATVGDYAITTRQVEEKIRTVHGKSTVEGALANPDQIQIALNAIMDQMVWGSAARDAGYDKDPQIAREVAVYQAELMAKKYLADTIDRQAEPTEAEIEAFYKENQQHYIRPLRTAIRHIQVGSRARAEQILGQLRGGADFAALARQFSEDAATKDIGGALGYVTESEGAIGIGKDPGFTTAALALQPGELSDVVEVSGRFHVLRCEDREGGEPLALNDVRDDIIRRAKPKKFADIYNVALEQMRTKYKAQINEANFNMFVGVTDSAERLWQLIAEQSEARGRVELARRIAFDFPRHELADDAQLMIAYTQATGLNDRKAAEKALQSFKNRFPNSPLRGSADWLLSHINDEQIPARSFEELLAQSKR